MVPEWEEIAAVSMAVQNMYLTCTANNIGCYWSSPKIVDHLKESLTLRKTRNVGCSTWVIWINSPDRTAV
jgi:nitroreductase